MTRHKRRKASFLVSFVAAAATAYPAQAESAAKNPWDQLPPNYQFDLRPTLNNLRHYAWHNAAYTKWFEKWWTVDGKPKPGAPPKDAMFHIYYFNNVLTRADRNSLILVYAKMAKEGLWGVVKMVKWAGNGVSMLFEPHMSQSALRTFLKKKEYGDWWFASKGNPWGMRSRFRGVQLHFRGGSFVNAHIDLNNPGDPPTGEPTGALSELFGAIRHYEEDLKARERTHTNSAVRAGLKTYGIIVPEID